MKKIHGNSIKDIVVVTSSNVSPNDGTIRTLTIFLAKTHMVREDS